MTPTAPWSFGADLEGADMTSPSPLLRFVGAVALAGWSASCVENAVQEAKSPVGDVVAVALSTPDIDPPNQRIVLRRGANEQALKTLAPDNEACTSIVWRHDGRLVGFVISSQDGTYVRLYDAASGRYAARVNVGAPHHVILHPTILTDDSLSFDDCGSASACVRRQVRFEVVR
jgi:hypothetical protein